MTDAIDIHEPVAAICDALGIEHDSTALIELRVEPSEVTAVVYKRNDHGSHYVDPVTNAVAAERLTFKVLT